MTNGPSCVIKLYNCLLLSIDETKGFPKRIIHKHILLQCLWEMAAQDNDAIAFCTGEKKIYGCA